MWILVGVSGLWLVSRTLACMSTPKAFIVPGNYHTGECVEFSVDRHNVATPVQLNIYPANPKGMGDDRGLSAFLSPGQVDELVCELERIREMLRGPELGDGAGVSVVG